jgi:hypothetical protein
MLADLIVRTHKAGRDCFEQADLWPQPFREVNLKYALKAADSSARLLARLEDYRVKKIEKIERLQNSATGGRKRVASSKLDRGCKNQGKARLNFNGNGKHP